MMNVIRIRLIVNDIEASEMPIVAQEAIKLWNSDPQSLKYIQSSSNFVFRFVQENVDRILRLQHAKERPKNMIEAELDFILHAASSEIKVARPVTSAKGNLVEEIQSNGEVFYGTVFEAMQGEQLNLDGLNSEMFKQWEKTLGHLHKASMTFTPKPDRVRFSWNDELEEKRKWIPSQDSFVLQELDKLYGWLSNRLQSPENYGLIHRDLELDNMIWDGHQFQVFDFDDLMYHWFAADVAASVEDMMISLHSNMTGATETFFGKRASAMGRAQRDIFIPASPATSLARR